MQNDNGQVRTGVKIYVIQIARVDKDGENPKEVLSDPPNIRTNGVKKGAAIDSTLFSLPGYNAVGDMYKQRGNVLERKEDRTQ